MAGAEVERNKVVARRLLEGLWSGGELALADELFARELVHHNMPAGMPGGPAGQRAFLELMRARMPDMRTTILGVFGEGEHVAVRWRRQFRGPSGDEVEFEG